MAQLNKFEKFLTFFFFYFIPNCITIFNKWCTNSVFHHYFKKIRKLLQFCTNFYSFLFSLWYYRCLIKLVFISFIDLKSFVFNINVNRTNSFCRKFLLIQLLCTSDFHSLDILFIQTILSIFRYILLQSPQRPYDGQGGRSRSRVSLHLNVWIIFVFFLPVNEKCFNMDSDISVSLYFWKQKHIFSLHL